MVERWWAEAERNQVLPLDNRPFSDMVFGRPPTVRARDRYTYWPGRAPVPESVAVNVRGRPHLITAHVTVPEGVDVIEGVLAVQGSVLGGWSFHLLGDGRLVYVHNLAGWRSYRVEAPVAADGRLAPGDHTLAMRFTPPLVELEVDGVVVGTGEVKRTLWSRLSLTGAGLHRGLVARLLPRRRGLPRPLRVHRHPAPRRHRRGGHPGHGPRGRGPGHHRLPVALRSPDGPRPQRGVAPRAGRGRHRAAAPASGEGSPTASPPTAPASRSGSAMPTPALPPRRRSVGSESPPTSATPIRSTQRWPGRSTSSVP